MLTRGATTRFTLFGGTGLDEIRGKDEGLFTSSNERFSEVNKRREIGTRNVTLIYLSRKVVLYLG